MGRVSSTKRSDQYPISREYAEFLVQFHRNEKTRKLYVLHLEKAQQWFIEKGICPKDFVIWRDVNQVDRIDKLLNTTFKDEWTEANKKGTGEGGANNWFSAPWNKWMLFLKERHTKKSTPLIDERDLSEETFDLKCLKDNLELASLNFGASIVHRFASSLLSKPFLILSGLSGSGKTKLAQAFAQWICASERQYRIVPVGADWTSREPLFGYANALEQGKYVRPESGVLDVLLHATEHPTLPHFLILDEMNLSHVERYFADFLSGIESGEELPLHAAETDMDGVPSKLRLPKNLFIIGTVNIDETTYMFSPKVLDRANVIEFRVSADEMTGFLGNPVKPNLDGLKGKGAGMAADFVNKAKEVHAYSDKEGLNLALLLFFAELKKCGAEFGYRSANEIHGLAGKLQLLNKDITLNEVVDIALMQKLLPKVHGSRKKMEKVLKKLAGLCAEKKVDTDKLLDNPEFLMPEGVKYPMALEKLWRMYRGAVDNGFTSYAEA